ncbi:40347_t:CDS:2, partial [Gigaspora margarita]
CLLLKLLIMFCWSHKLPQNFAVCETGVSAKSIVVGGNNAFNKLVEHIVLYGEGQKEMAPIEEESEES